MLETHGRRELRNNRAVLNQVKCILTQLTIALRMQTSADHKVGELYFDDAWKIRENRKKLAGPIDIKTNITEVSIGWVRNQLSDVLAYIWLDEQDKKVYEAGVNTYLDNLEKEYLQSFRYSPSKSFYYKQYKDGILTKDECAICFTLANFLKKYKGAIGEKGEITEQWLMLLHKKLLDTKIAYEVPGKWINKVFHDGDLLYVFESQEHGILKNYIDVITYLLDRPGFNPYSDNNEEGGHRRSRNKSNFLDFWYSFLYVDSEQEKEIEEFHISSIQNMDKIVARTVAKSGNQIEVTGRIKTAASIAKKAYTRTEKIFDNLWTRVVYYRDESNIDSVNEDIKSIIIEYLKEQIELAKHQRCQIHQIEIANKKAMDEQTHELIVAAIRQQAKGIKVIVRQDKSSHSEFLDIESLENNVKWLEQNDDFAFTNELKSMYNLLIFGSKGRWWNGTYEDYKFTTQFSYQNKDRQSKTFGQETQMYNYKNDVGFSNHNILDLEKDIFSYCKSNQDMSLSTLRRKTAKTIKNMAWQAERIKERMPNLNEEMWMFEVQGKKISLLGLNRDTKDNQGDMRTLTCAIVNELIKERKLIHIYADDRYPNTWFILPKDLIFGSEALKHRFTTNEVVRSAAFSKQIDVKKHIAMYDHEDENKDGRAMFSSSPVEDVIDIINAGYKRKEG